MYGVPPFPKFYAKTDAPSDFCPVLLIKFRKTVDSLEHGEILVVAGVHEPSKDGIISVEASDGKIARFVTKYQCYKFTVYLTI